MYYNSSTRVCTHLYRYTTCVHRYTVYGTHTGFSRYPTYLCTFMYPVPVVFYGSTGLGVHLCMCVVNTTRDTTHNSLAAPLHSCVYGIPVCTRTPHYLNFFMKAPAKLFTFLAPSTYASNVSGSPT